MGNSTGNANKKSTKEDRNDKTKEKGWKMFGQKEKSNTRKNNNTTCENKPENNGERRMIKKILTKAKTTRSESNTLKQRKKIPLTRSGRWYIDILTSGCQRN